MPGALQPPTDCAAALRELAAEVGVKFATLEGVWLEKAHAYQFMAGIPRDEAEAKALRSVVATYRKRLQ